MVIAINVTDDKQKKALLLSDVGEDLTTGAEGKSYEYIITLIDRHFAPKSSISCGQYFFQNFNQNYD